MGNERTHWVEFEQAYSYAIARNVAMNERIDALEEDVLAEIPWPQERLDGMIQRLERINNMLRLLIGLVASVAICTVAIHVLM